MSIISCKTTEDKHKNCQSLNIGELNMGNTNPILTEKQVLEIALPLLKTKCSNDEFELFKPWVAIYHGDGNWTVSGTLPERTKGGTPEAIISDKDGKVINVYRMK